MKNLNFRSSVNCRAENVRHDQDSKLNPRGVRIQVCALPCFYICYLLTSDVEIQAWVSESFLRNKNKGRIQNFIS